MFSLKEHGIPTPCRRRPLGRTTDTTKVPAQKVYNF
jgi:hypothetical protein